MKILQKCGTIEKFDLLFHRSGLLVGQPRGYAFVTYKHVRDATVALNKLNGTRIGTKNVCVRLAKNINYVRQDFPWPGTLKTLNFLFTFQEEYEKPKPKIEIPALAGSAAGKEKKLSKNIAIQALEAQLRQLQNKSEDLVINKSVVNNQQQPAIIQKYQGNKNQPPAHSTSYARGRHKNSGPYRKTGYKR